MESVDGIDIEEAEPKPERKASDPVVIKLKEPIQWGKDLIEEITLRFNTRAMKDVTITVKPDGSKVLIPYDLAQAGMRMAGHPDGVFNKLGGADFMELAAAAALFIS